MIPLSRAQACSPLLQRLQFLCLPDPTSLPLPPIHPSSSHTGGPKVEVPQAGPGPDEMQSVAQEVGATLPNLSPKPTPGDLLARAKCALHHFLSSQESASYLLDTSSAYALQALSNPTLPQFAITSSQSESMLSVAVNQDFDASSPEFSIGSENLIVPQIALGGTYFGIAVAKHASIPTAAPSTAEASLPKPELTIGRFAGKNVSSFN